MGEVPKQMGGRPTYSADFIHQDSDRGVFLESDIAANLYSSLLTVAAKVSALRRCCMSTDLQHESRDNKLLATKA